MMKSSSSRNAFLISALDFLMTADRMRARACAPRARGLSAAKCDDTPHARGARQVRLKLSVTVRMNRSGLPLRSKGAYSH
jgi:hypothetical protein